MYLNFFSMFINKRFNEIEEGKKKQELFGFETMVSVGIFNPDKNAYCLN